MFRGMTPVEMLGLTEFPRIGELPYFLTLAGYGFYWFRLQHTPSSVLARTAPETPEVISELPALLVGAAWDTLLEGNVRTLIERDLLIPFLQRQRWFGSKARPVRSARFGDWGLLRRGAQPLFLTLVDVEFEDEGRAQYLLPLTAYTYPEAQWLAEKAPHAVLANITGARGASSSTRGSTTTSRARCSSARARGRSGTRQGIVRGLPGRELPALRGEGDLRIGRMSAEQSNTSIVYGDRLILKLFRRLEVGINPDFEVGRHLTERVGFRRVPALAGALEYTGLGETPSTIAMMQEMVESQGDGWTHATDEVKRFYELVQSRPRPRSRRRRRLATWPRPSRRKQSAR
jgi:maltose alpha-D-glucosyltransferase / alpha-amylase